MSYCPSCQRDRPPAAGSGLCPQCLLKAGLGATETPETMWPGQWFGHFEVLERIGHGGMGVVFKARQRELKRLVALKMIRSAHLASAAEIERFHREAEAVARLDHPHIVSLYEYGDHDGSPYMAMRLVEDGRSLGTVLKQGPVSQTQAAQWLATVARAVHFAHQRGVLHRDIKPGNIMLDPHDQPLLADFGLARMQDGRSSWTHADQALGTPGYMSPEQAGGGGQITTASDIYSLGAVLYELLTGRPPLQSEQLADLLRKVVNDEPPRLRSLDPCIDRDLETMALKCLEKEPDRRYGSGEALAEDLERWLTHRPILARPISPAGRIAKWARRRPGVAALTTALTVTGLIALAAVTWSWRSAVRARQEQTSLTWNALLAESRARRWSKQPGQRFGSLAAVRRAADLRLDPALRDETIAALALADVRMADTWPGNPDRQAMVALSADFQQAAHCLADGTVIITDRPTGRVAATLPGDGTPAGWILEFSDDGRWLAAGYARAGADHSTVVVWDWKTAKPWLRIENVPQFAVDFDGSGSHFVAGSATGCRRWELPDLHELPPPTQVSGEPRCLQISPDGTKLAVAYVNYDDPAIPAETRRRVITIHDLADPSAAPVRCEVGPTVRHFAWNPAGTEIAAPCDDGSVAIIRAAGGVVRRRINAHLKDATHVAWSPDGLMLASASWDGTLSLWQPSTGELMVTAEYTAGPLTFSRDGTRLGLIKQGTAISLLEVAHPGISVVAEDHPKAEIFGRAWSPDGSLFATTANHQVWLWNPAGVALARIPFPGVHGVAFSGNSLFASGLAGVLRWPVHTAGTVATMGPPVRIAPDGPWKWLALAPDAGRVAVADGDRVFVFNVESPHDPVILDDLPAATILAWSDDARWLAAGTWKGRGVQVWSMPEGRPVATLDVPGSATVAFTPSAPRDSPSKASQWLITGNADTYCAWRTGVWTAGRTMPNRGGDMWGLIAISPRNTIMAVSHDRRHMRIVSPDSFAQIAEPDAPVHVPLSFSPDGATLATSDTNGHLHFWKLPMVRRELAALASHSLDWDFPPLPEAVVPLVNRVDVVGGALPPSSN